MVFYLYRVSQLGNILLVEGVTKTHSIVIRQYSTSRKRYKNRKASQLGNRYSTFRKSYKNTQYKSYKNT